MKFHASDIQLSSSGGEYFKVSLSESDEEHCPYVLLQNGFEFPRSSAYFECHDLNLAGFDRVKRCELYQTSLEIEVSDSAEHITVTFNEPDEKIGNLVWILGIILTNHVPFLNSSGIPKIPIEEEED